MAQGAAPSDGQGAGMEEPSITGNSNAHGDQEYADGESVQPVQFSVKVEKGSALQEWPEPPKKGERKRPQCGVCVCLADEEEEGPAAEMVEADDEDVHPFEYERAIDLTPGPDLMRRLVKNSLRVLVMEAGKKGKAEEVGRVEIDLLPFALGKEEMEGSYRVKRDESSKSSLRDDGQLSVSVTLSGSPSTEEDISKGNVIWVRPLRIQPAPQYANQAQFSFGSAVELPEVGKVFAFDSGTWEEGESEGDQGGEAFISWQSQKWAREFLTADETTRLKGAIKGNSCATAEAGRLLKSDVKASDPHVTKHRARGSLRLAPLVAPGCTACELGCTLEAVDDSLPLLIPRQEKGGKALQEQAPSECPLAGARADFEMKLERPLLPSWRPPKEPGIELSEFLPPPKGEEEALSEQEQAEEDTKKFRQEMRELAAEIAGEWMNIEEDSENLTDVRDPKKRWELMYRLNRSGKYSEVREKMRRAMQRFIPRFGKPSESHDAIHDLYSFCMGEVHKALQQEPPEPERPPDAERASQLLALANEYEEAEEYGLARERHEDHVAETEESLESWAYFGRYLLRAGDRGKGDEALKLAASKGSQESLLDLALYTFDLGEVDRAEACAKALTDVSMGFSSHIPWICLAFVYRHQQAQSPFTSRAEEDIDLAEHRASQLAPEGSDLYLDLARYAVELCLTGAAKAALGSAKEGPAKEECLARCALLQGDVDECIGLVEACMQSQLADAGLYQLRGDARFARSEFSAAVEDYESALAAANGECSLRLHCRLATALAMEGRHDEAAGVFVEACKRFPWSCSAWRGAGEELMEASRLDEAEEALAESNNIDWRNSRVWAKLAICCLNKSRPSEAKECLRFSFKHGSPSVEHLVEAGKLFITQEWLGDAERTLRAAMAHASPASPELLDAMSELAKTARCSGMREDEAARLYADAAQIADVHRARELWKAASECYHAAGHFSAAEEALSKAQAPPSADEQPLSGDDDNGEE